MELFNVYQRFDVNLKNAQGAHVYDDKNQEYLDFYGGHGVISIGHNHAHWKNRIQDQMNGISFYSNSVRLDIQQELAFKLGEISSYPEHSLFLCNSGAEANENALKLASFHTGKKKFIAFKDSFHGRTSGTLNVTYNKKLASPMNKCNFPVSFIEINDVYMLKKILTEGDVAGVIIEGIQGVGGLNEASAYFFERLVTLCKEFGALLILDEIQSGFGRTGKFFAHQHSGIEADIITVAKGMGNGFPVAGVLISPEIQSYPGMLGTTFGGNPMACAASIAVIETLKKEKLLDNASQMELVVRQYIQDMPSVKKISGRGLMLGLEFNFPIDELRKTLLYDFKIFTGSSVNPNQLRILPPLCIQQEQLMILKKGLKLTAYESVH